MSARKKLIDILSQDQQASLAAKWNSTEAAAEFKPLPPGEYIARLASGELETSRKSTPGYKLEFVIIEGEYTGRKFWHDCWLTAAAMPQAKRDLSKLGIVDSSQLERPIPPGIICRVKVSLRREDDGTERNRVQWFDVDRIEAPEAEPFAPVDAPPSGSPEDAAATPESF